MKKDKDGKQLDPPQYDLTDENMEKFGKEFAELNEEKIEIDFKPIKLEQLGDINLKPIVLVQLGKLIEE